MPVDVADEGSVSVAMAIVADRLGPVDILVNNAGANRVVGPLWEIDVRDWWQDVTVNLLGPVLCSRAVLPRMVERGGGRIVNIVSGAGGRAFPYNTAYSASKAALIRLTDSLAAETAEHGIGVFALNPGRVDTKLGRDLRASTEGQRWMAAMWSAMAEPIPAERAAATVVFLASGRADSLSGCWFDMNDDVPKLVDDARQLNAGEFFRMRLRRP